MIIHNIELEEKTDSSLRIVHRDETTNLPVDLTGHTAILQIRPEFGSDVLLDQLLSTDGTIVLGGQSGTLDLIFTSLDTDATSSQGSWTKGVYDLVLVDSQGKREKIRKGFIVIARSATL
jgi:hypothetical protein